MTKIVLGIGVEYSFTGDAAEKTTTCYKSYCAVPVLGIKTAPNHGGGTRALYKKITIMMLIIEYPVNFAEIQNRPALFNLLKDKNSQGSNGF